MLRWSRPGSRGFKRRDRGENPRRSQREPGLTCLRLIDPDILVGPKFEGEVFICGGIYDEGTGAGAGRGFAAGVGYGYGWSGGFGAERGVAGAAGGEESSACE